MEDSERNYSDDVVLGVQLDAIRVNYSKSAKKSFVLKDISFRAEPGQITAIMGPFRKNRTALLELISGRRLYGRYSGEILAGGLPKGPFFVFNSAYVPMDDLYLPGLTFKETLDYAALQRLGRDENTSEHREERVEQVLDVLKLNECKDIVIEDTTTRGTLGGQLKRLSIAVETIGMPSLVFLDEPTTKLDDAVALEVMENIRDIAKRNHTVIMTLNHPSPELFDLVDKVILLSDNHLIYAGAADAAEQYFMQAPLNYERSTKHSVPDFIVDIAGGLERPKFQRGTLRPEELATAFVKSCYYFRPGKSLGNVIGSGSYSATPESTKNASRQNSTNDAERTTSMALASAQALLPLYSKPPLPRIRLKALLTRAFLVKIRERKDIAQSIGRAIVSATFLGLIELNQAGEIGDYLLNFFKNSYPAVSNVTGSLFYVAFYSVLVHAMAIHRYCYKSVVYYHEAIAGESAVILWLASVISEIPFVILYQCVFSVVLYLFLGFDFGWTNLANFCVATSATALAGMSLALWVSAATKSEIASRNIILCVALILSFISGYMSLLPQMTTFWRTLSNISLFRFSFQASMIWAFDGYADTYVYLKIYGFEGRSFEYAIQVVCLFAGIFLLMYLFAMTNPSNSLQHFRWRLKSKAPKKKVVGIGGVPISGKNSKGKVNNETDDDDDEEEEDEDDEDEGGVLLDGSRFSQPFLIRKFPSMSSNYSEGAFSASGDISGLAENISMSARPDILARGHHIVFQKLRLRGRDAKRSAKYKMILNDVSGMIQPGELTAVLGLTNSGKTSLIELLAGRKLAAEHTGIVLFDDVKPDRLFYRSCAYVIKDNVQLKSLTVRQTIEYSAALRCSDDVVGNSAQLSIYVNRVLEMLSLKKYADRIVDTLRPGVVKRLSIAEEVVNMPRTLFLDEPTTNLPLQDITDIVSCLRDMVYEERTVVTTLHKPQPEVFEMIDKLILLSDGYVVYCGPSDRAVEVFESSPFNYRMAAGANHADFLVSVVGGLIHNSDGRSLKAVELDAFWKQTNQCKTVDDMISNSCTQFRVKMIQSEDKDSNVLIPGDYGSSSGPSSNQSSSNQNWSVSALFAASTPESSFQKAFHNSTDASQSGASRDYSKLVRNFLMKHARLPHEASWVLLKRQFVRYWQNRSFLAINLMLHVIAGVAVGCVYWDNGDNGYEVEAFLFLSMLLLLCMNAHSLSPIWEEHRLFVKERLARLYGPLVAGTAFTLPLVLIRLVNGLIFMLITRTMIGLTSDSRPASYYYLVMSLVNLNGLFLTQLIVMLAPDLRTAFTAFPLVALIQMSFAGMLCKLPSLDDWLVWGPYLSIFRFGLQGLTLIEFKYSSELLPKVAGFNAYNAFITSLGFDTFNAWECVYILIAIMAVLRILAYIAMRFFQYHLVYGGFPPIPNSPLIEDSVAVGVLPFRKRKKEWERQVSKGLSSLSHSISRGSG